MTSSRRPTRAALLAAVTCAALAGGCAPVQVTGVRDPAAARRFEVLDVADSTFRVILGGMPWVRPGFVGIVVDPARRDALIARFEVRRLVADTATVAITGQTARVANTHIALMNAPPARVNRREAFWLGALSGAVLSAAVALSVR